MSENEIPLSSLAAPYIFGAAVIGPAHEERQMPCQDACSFAPLGDAMGVVAVADGLGSAARAEVGARAGVLAAVAAVQAAVETPTTPPPTLAELARQAMAQARECIEATAQEQNRRLRDLACTLIVVVFQGNRASAAHIGDGAVVARTAAGLALVSDPGDSEYVNEVTPLTVEKWDQSVRISPELEGVESLAVFTDGCQRGCLIRTPEGHRPSAQFFDPLFHYARELSDLDKGVQDVARLLGSRKFAEVSEDDKTLVVAVLPQVPTHHEPDSL